MVLSQTSRGTASPGVIFLTVLGCLRNKTFTRELSERF
jgi:hypothetical protein